MKPRYGKREWGLWRHVLPFLSKTVHEHYQIEIPIHSQLFPFTLAPTSPLLSTLLPSTIPFLSVLSLN